MTLRYVPQLPAGAEIILKMPFELKRLATQFAPVTDELISECWGNVS
jgi:hypothetical protein